MAFSNQYGGVPQIHPASSGARMMMEALNSASTDQSKNFFSLAGDLGKIGANFWQDYNDNDARQAMMQYTDSKELQDAIASGKLDLSETSTKFQKEAADRIKSLAETKLSQVTADKNQFEFDKAKALDEAVTNGQEYFARANELIAKGDIAGGIKILQNLDPRVLKEMGYDTAKWGIDEKHHQDNMKYQYADLAIKQRQADLAAQKMAMEVKEKMDNDIMADLQAYQTVYPFDNEDNTIAAIEQVAKNRGVSPDIVKEVLLSRVSPNAVVTGDGSDRIDTLTRATTKSGQFDTDLADLDAEQKALNSNQGMYTYENLVKEDRAAIDNAKASNSPYEIGKYIVNKMFPDGKNLNEHKIYNAGNRLMSELQEYNKEHPKNQISIEDVMANYQEFIKESDVDNWGWDANPNAYSVSEDSDGDHNRIIFKSGNELKNAFSHVANATKTARSLGDTAKARETLDALKTKYNVLANKIANLQGSARAFSPKTQATIQKFKNEQKKIEKDFNDTIDKISKTYKTTISSLNKY